MANYVLNKVVCTEKILNEFFIDYYPFEKDEKLKEPYITFNKILGSDSINITKSMGKVFTMVLDFHMKKIEMV